MRIRQVKPEFWRDRDIAKLPPTTRLTYIGLWGLADDAGWFRCDGDMIALELYGWEAVDQREAAVAAALDELEAAGRIVRHDCGHAFIPKFTAHQRFAGETKRVYTFKKEHERCPRITAVDPQTPAGDPRVSRDAPHVPATVRNGRGKRNVSVRQGSSDARKRDDESESEFRLRVGLPVFMGGDA